MSKAKFETVEDAVKHIEELEKGHKAVTDEYDAKIADLEKRNTEALEEVGSLSEQLDLRSQNAEGGEVVTVGKKNYSIRGKRFNIPGFGVLTAAELGKNMDALEYLVKVKSGVLVAAKGSK